MTLTGSPCATATTLQGSVTNTNVTLQAETPDNFNNIATLSGSIKQNTLSGDFSSSLVGCTSGDFGTWTASKQ